MRSSAPPSSTRSCGCASDGRRSAFRGDEPRSLAALRRHLEAEALAQTLDVEPVDVVELGVGVPPDLELRRDARNPDASDSSPRLQALAGPAVRHAACGIRLPPVAALVELQWMAVDLPALAVTQDEARRPFVVGPLELGQDGAEAIDVLEADVEDVVGVQLNRACARSRPSASSASTASAARATIDSASSSGVKFERT